MPDLNSIDSRQQDSPVLSILGGLEAYVASLDLDGSPLHRVVTLVLDKASHSSVHLSQIPQQ